MRVLLVHCRFHVWQGENGRHLPVSGQPYDAVAYVDSVADVDSPAETLLMLAPFGHPPPTEWPWPVIRRGTRDPT